MSGTAGIDPLLMWFVWFPIIHVVLIGVLVGTRWRKLAPGRQRIWALYGTGGSALVWPTIGLAVSDIDGAVGAAAIMAIGAIAITWLSARAQLNWWTIRAARRMRSESSPVESPRR